MSRILQVAWRNLGRNRRRTAVVMIAVVVGMSGTVFSMALNAGMVFGMVETAIATELGHLQIHARGFEAGDGSGPQLSDGGKQVASALTQMEPVRSWAPRVRSDGLVFSPRASVGVRLLGVDPARESSVSLVARSVVEGSYLDGTSHRLLLGEALARRLQVGVRDKVVLSVQDLAGELTGEAFRVVGIFRTSSSDFDGSTVFLRLEEAQRLLGLGEAVSEIVVLVQRRSQIPELRQVLSARLGEGIEVRSWDEIEPILKYFVEFFDETAWVVYLAVFIAMAFGIANVLLMSVYERRREIGLLMALGMRPRRVVAMVVVESLLLTLLGVALGFGLAWLAALANSDGIDLSFFAEGLAAYGIGSHVVPVVRLYDLVVPGLVAFATALLASLWPAVQAVRWRPAEALRQL
jgi:ABC-type lipoprotein release transport system permease subunit